MFYLYDKYDCTFFTSRVNVFNGSTVRTEGNQITLYFKMSSISLVKYFCCHENNERVNKVVQTFLAENCYALFLTLVL